VIGGDFFARSVHDVARDLVGCTLLFDGCGGTIVGAIGSAVPPRLRTDSMIVASSAAGRSSMRRSRSESERGASVTSTRLPTGAGPL